MGCKSGRFGVSGQEAPVKERNDCQVYSGRSSQLEGISQAWRGPKMYSR